MVRGVPGGIGPQSLQTGEQFPGVRCTFEAAPAVEQEDVRWFQCLGWTRWVRCLGLGWGRTQGWHHWLECGCMCTPSQHASGSPDARRCTDRGAVDQGSQTRLTPDPLADLFGDCCLCWVRTDKLGLYRFWGGQLPGGDSSPRQHFSRGMTCVPAHTWARTRRTAAGRRRYAKHSSKCACLPVPNYNSGQA